MKHLFIGTLIVELFVAGAALCQIAPAVAEEYGDSAALAKAMSAANVSLERGIKASEREGKPISGKYEVEDGALQLSVYTVKSGKFSEVIVDHKSGTISKAEPITEKDDLADAEKQNDAMSKAKLSLDQAVQSTVRTNAGYRAVSAIPALEDGRPVAQITLMKGAEVKKVTANLD
jgi:hypothetical protein